MPADRSGEPLTDLDIDRALKTALAVEPSPAFLARVRMRIASEPEPSGWRLSWVFAGGACTIAIAVAVTVMQMSHPTFSPDAASRAVGSLSFIPAWLPGPLAMAASAPQRGRREKPTLEMQTLMKSTAAANTALAAHVREKNYDAIFRDATALEQNLANTEVFWTERKMDAALAITRTALDAAGELQAAALAKDDAAIERAAATMIGACGACHKQHRDQLPDQSYEIRL
jgi:cytochrome c556